MIRSGSCTHDRNVCIRYQSRVTASGDCGGIDVNCIGHMSILAYTCTVMHFVQWLLQSSKAVERKQCTDKQRLLHCTTIQCLYAVQSRLRCLHSTTNGTMLYSYCSNNGQAAAPISSKAIISEECAVITKLLSAYREACGLRAVSVASWV